uniref:Uncharacterized protein n=1 Tax=Rhizophagus irregularis (strain DAOM 181602 / DAOM 197198 / MUCL 43194) TaxID=747089 RepID=U9UD52_RHIID
MWCSKLNETSIFVTFQWITYLHDMKRNSRNRNENKHTMLHDCNNVSQMLTVFVSSVTFKRIGTFRRKPFHRK